MHKKHYFFCGIGGSGMFPLAVLLHARGHMVSGSDRSYDQGKTPDKFKALRDLGINLVMQDGMGVTENVETLVVSSAVEERIPDVQVALSLNIPIIKRGALLAEVFNYAKQRIAIAGTSGKSTVTGMVGTVLVELGYNPTVVNGGQVRNFSTEGSALLASVRNGDRDLCVAEMDESDGSIAHYVPTIAALNNIALDHMTMDALERLFGDYMMRAEGAVVANYDDMRVRDLCADRKCQNVISFAIGAKDADITARNITPHSEGISFDLHHGDDVHAVSLSVPGRHNVANALCALSICLAMGVPLPDAARALSVFSGIHRRMEMVGTQNGITVYDDFGHNPDKIAASLQCLKEHEGRLIVMFQPHGFGPLRLMRVELVEAFASHLSSGDVLLMPEVYYAGGTVDRSVTAMHLIEDLKAKGIDAHWFEKRNDIPAFIERGVQKGDRVVIMGARDDTLHDFAHGVLGGLR